MDLIKYCVPCASCAPDQPFPQLQEQYFFTTEKPTISPFNDDPANEFLQTLRTTDTSGKELDERLKSIISATGLTDAIAERILHGIEDIIKQGAKVADTMNQATTRATNVAWGFAQEYPEYALLIAAGTIVALGVLAILAPWVVEVLGFGLRGPRAGSFAARWMSAIAKSDGHVPQGSLYSYLQRLGMTWRAG